MRELARRLRRLPILAVASLTGHAQGGVGAGDALVAPKPTLWDCSVSVRAAAGYKDNLMLSNKGAQDSAFWRSGLDLMLFRLPSGGAEYSFFFSGDDWRFISGEQPDKEQTFFAVAQAEREIDGRWGYGCSLQYFYQDQVLDASITETNLFPIQVQGHGLAVRPGARLNIGHGAWAEVEFPLNRYYFAEPLDDYWEGGPRFVLRRPYGRQSEMSVSYEIGQRRYDTRLRTDADGYSIEGTSLEFMVQRAEFAWSHYWETKRRFRTVLKGGFESNQDNGSGYFDYKRYFASLGLRWKSGAFEARASGSLGVYDYSVQPGAEGLDPKRAKTTVTLDASLGLNLSKRLRAFAEFEHEESLANIPFDNYRVNTVCSGLEWEF
jgi:hypothetical protein